MAPRIIRTSAARSAAGVDRRREAIGGGGSGGPKRRFQSYPSRESTPYRGAASAMAMSRAGSNQSEVSMGRSMLRTGLVLYSQLRKSGPYGP
jgi:hypothetical protein